MAEAGPIELMRRETRCSYGVVTHSLSSDPLRQCAWQLVGNQFLLRGEGDHYFLYRKGAGIKIERGADADLSEESLWLNGSVYAAVASMNGLLPIHASAVVANDMVFAIAGPPGAGKSTLTAALGRLGLPMFCDDTLVLDLSHPDRTDCLPGHKRLKLTREAIRLTGATEEEKVSATVDKYFARPLSGTVSSMLPLAELIHLERGEQTKIEAIRGAERLSRLDDDHYTNTIYARAQGFDRAALFGHLSHLSDRIAMARFVRPTSDADFEGVVETLRNYIRTRAERALKKAHDEIREAK